MTGEGERLQRNLVDCTRMQRDAKTCGGHTLICELAQHDRSTRMYMCRSVENITHRLLGAGATFSPSCGILCPQGHAAQKSDAVCIRCTSPPQRTAVSAWFLSVVGGTLCGMCTRYILRVSCVVSCCFFPPRDLRAPIQRRFCSLSILGTAIRQAACKEM